MTPPGPARLAAAGACLLAACRDAPPPADGVSGPATAAAVSRDEGVVRLPAARARLVGLTTTAAVTRPLARRWLTPGRVAFDDRLVARVYAPVSGRVDHVAVEVGDHVLRGQRVATLASPAMGALARDVAAARADVQAARKDLARQQVLVAARAAPARVLEDAEEAAARAQATLRQVEQKGAVLGGGGDDILTLRAPVDGEVVARDVGPGAEVQGQSDNPGDPRALLTIGSTARVWVEAEVAASDLAAVEVGAPATVAGVAANAPWMPGQVDWVSHVVDADSGAGRVRVAVDNLSERLRVGMDVRVCLAGRVAPRLVVPRASVLSVGGKPLVFVQQQSHDPDCWAFRRQLVEVDFDLPDGLVEVRAGVRAGERVVEQQAVLLSES